MLKLRVGILKGDDIGLEVVPEAVKVLQKAVEGYPSIEITWVELPVGYSAYIEKGETLPDTTVKDLYGLDGWLLGPIGHMNYPKDPKAVNPHPLLRKEFDLVSNIRPFKSFYNVKSLHDDIDMIFVRENNEGFPCIRNMHRGSAEFMPDQDTAMSLRIITRRNSTMVAKEAFELARRRNIKNKVTAVHKNTMFKLGCGLFYEACEEVAKDYPDIELESCMVDTFAMNLVMNPQQYDVIVTTNLFGDILTDLAAGLVGGLGMAPGLGAGPKYAMAQATHGSAPDISGKQIANPYAMIMSAQMLLMWLGNRNNSLDTIAAAMNIEKAVNDVLSSNTDLTRDLGGNATTSQMGTAICRRLEEIMGARV